MTPRHVRLVGLVATGHSGVARYTVALARALDRVSAEFPDLRLTLLATAAAAEVVAPERITVEEVRRARRIRGGPLRIAAEQLALLPGKPALLHFFDLTGPLLARSRPFVTTAHDATVAYGFNPLRGGYKRLLYPWALRRARAVVAVSKFAGDEVVRHFGADPARLHVVHSGPGLSSAPPSTPTADDGDPYVLFVGNLAANKNLPFLVRAFARSSTAARLVLAGRPGEGYRDVVAEIARSGRSGRVEVRPDVSDDEVERLYRGARALVLPSVYEGFGFTPLEAMARDCPVVASDIPAVREVSGDGALLLPPADEDAWVSAIDRVVASPELRDELRKRGRATVGRYSWERTAREVAGLFRSLLSP